MESNAIMAFRQLESLCWKEMTGFSRGKILFGVASLVGGAAKVSQNPGNKASPAAYWLAAKPTFPDLPLQQAPVSNSAPGTMAFCGITDQNMNWACSHNLPCAQETNQREVEWEPQLEIRSDIHKTPKQNQLEWLPLTWESGK